MELGDIGYRANPSEKTIGTACRSPPKRVALYKTELCRTFEEVGFCRYGSKCQFAHSIRELRSVQRHPRYKTEVCRTFWDLGTCPYGRRCCFIHMEGELERRVQAEAKRSQFQTFQGPEHNSDCLSNEVWRMWNPGWKRGLI